MSYRTTLMGGIDQADFLFPQAFPRLPPGEDSQMLGDSINAIPVIVFRVLLTMCDSMYRRV